MAMIDLRVTFKYYRKLNSKTVYVVLHGGGPEGIESPFITDIIDSLISIGKSVFSFNFPYCERGEEESSGSELEEETNTLDKVMESLEAEGYKEIIIVAKSLGGIIASYWLEQYPSKDIRVIILGYVIGSVKTETLRGKLSFVIQGENDRFGDANAVNKELVRHKVETRVIALPNADHSYRNDKKEPIYQKQAIKLLVKNLN